MDVSQQAVKAVERDDQYITGGNGRFPALIAILRKDQPVYHRGKWTFPSVFQVRCQYDTSISQGEMDVSQQPTRRALSVRQYITGGNGRFPARVSEAAEAAPVYHRGKWTFPS